MKIILASKSPRRQEILTDLGYDFKVITAETDESSDISEPSALVTELAKRKAYAVADLCCDNNSVIIACDTVVATENEILGKPKDEKDARRMLAKFSGNVHSVYSGLCLIKGDKVLTDYCKTDVYFDKLSKSDIDWYILQNEWSDKAGGYGIQGKASGVIRKIDGDYFNVVGLPVNTLYKMLKEFS